jgi:hypothetical protein
MRGLVETRGTAFKAGRGRGLQLRRLGVVRPCSWRGGVRRVEEALRPFGQGRERKGKGREGRGRERLQTDTKAAKQHTIG